MARLKGVRAEKYGHHAVEVIFDWDNDRHQAIKIELAHDAKSVADRLRAFAEFIERDNREDET
jgi:hypothetical protein